MPSYESGEDLRDERLSKAPKFADLTKSDDYGVRKEIFSYTPEKLDEVNKDIDNEINSLKEQFEFIREQDSELNEYAKRINQSILPIQGSGSEQVRERIRKQILDYETKFTNLTEQDIAAKDRYNELIQRKAVLQEKTALDEFNKKAEKGNWFGGLYNSLLYGVGELSAGITNDVIDIMVELMPEEMYGGVSKDDAKKQVKENLLPYIRKGTKELAGTEGTTDEYIQRVSEKNIFTEGVYGLARSAPAMISPYMSGMYFQVKDGIRQEMELTPELNEIDEWEKQAIQTPIALAGMFLERFGFSKLAKSTKAATIVTKEALSSLPKNATKKPIVDAISTTAQKAGIKLGSGFAAEAETGALQYVSDVGIKEIYNQIKGKDLFSTPETVKEFETNMFRAGLAEGIGGFGMVTLTAATTFMAKGNLGKVTNNEQYELVEQIISDPDAVSAKKEQLKAQLESGKLTDEQYETEINNIDVVAKIVSEIDSTLPIEKRREAFDLITEKKKIEGELAKLETNDQDLVAGKVKQYKQQLEEVSNKLKALPETESTSTQTTEEKKADINKRREEELEPVRTAIVSSEQTGEIPTVDGEPVSKKTLDEINAKYDAEISLLETETKPETKTKDDKQSQIDEINKRRVEELFNAPNEMLIAPLITNDKGQIIENPEFKKAKENKDKINAKYDTEIAALEQKEAIQQEMKISEELEQQPTDEQFDAALGILEPIASERRELTLEELENVYTALGENADQIFDISRKDKDALDLYNELTDKKNAKEARQVRKKGEQVQAEETGVGDMREVDQAETTQEGKEKVSEEEVNRIKSLPIENEDGATLNLDGSRYDGDGIVVPIASINTTQEKVTPKLIDEFIEQNRERIGSGERVTIGVYKFPNSDKVSIDLNLIADKSKAKEAVAIAKELGQFSVYDTSNGETITTGETGENTKSPSKKEIEEFKSRLTDEKQKAGNRIFNKPLEAVKEIADKYYERVFGKKRPIFKGITKINKELAKRIANAYEAMQNNPNDPEVRAAYEALARETMEQYKEFNEAGFTIEINNEEPYNNAQEMIDDLRENKRIKSFSTESGFGNTPITDKQRKENPLLRDSGVKDANGNTLLVNDIFRAIHDFYGHAELGNGFGAIGEENAWNVHARMFSPLARRAMTSETRGQNSWVNFSGVNEEAFKLRDKARELRRQGKKAEAQEIVSQIYEMMSFAEQKVGLLPREFSELSLEEGTATAEQKSKQEQPKEEIKENDEVTVYKDTYVSGKKTEKRYKAKVVRVNEDGTFDLRRGKLVFKNIKPNKISKIVPSNKTDIRKETEGLSFKDQIKQGFEEYVSSIKEKSREKLNNVVSFMKDKLSEQRKKLKDFKDRKSVVEEFAKDLLKGIDKAGVKFIPTRKVNTIINQIKNAKTDESLNKSADRLIEIFQNLAITDEEIKAKARRKKLKAQAKKNAKKKAGQMSDEIAIITSLDDVPSEIQKEYDEVLEDIGKRGTVVEIENPQKVRDLAQKISDKYSVTEEVVDDTNEVTRPEDKSEEMGSAMLELELIDDSEPIFDSKEKNGIVRIFKKLSDEFLATLPKTTLKNIAKEARNIQNGFMSNSFAEAINNKYLAYENAQELGKSKNIFTNIKNRIDNGKKKAKTLFDKAAKIQLNHIDQMLGSIQNTAIYEKIVSPLTRAFNKSTLETKEFTKQLVNLANKAIVSRVGRISKSAGFNSEAQFRLNVITDLFLIDKQHQLNPDSKITPPVSSIIETINKDIEKEGAKAGYTEKDVEIINEIYNKAPKNEDGTLDLDAYKDKYMTKQEADLIDFLEKMYEDYKDKAIYVSEQLRGETLATFNAYAPRNTVTQRELSTQDKIDQWKGKTKKASNIKSRTATTPLVRLGGVTNALRYVSEINDDYYGTKAIRIVDQTLTYLKDFISDDNKKFVEEFRGFIDSHITEQYNKSQERSSELDKFINETARGVYSNLLINFKRFLPEFISNAFASTAELKNFYRASKDNKFKDIIFNSANVMKKFGSAHADRIGTFTLDLRDVESAPLGEGFKSSDAKTSSQLNELMANNAVKNFSKAANKMYYNIVDFMIPHAWGAEMSAEFKKETGKSLDFDKLSKDDNYYLDNKRAIDKSLARADKHVSDLYNTASQFEKRLDSKQTKSAFKQMLNYFMQSFSFNENSVIWSGAKSAIGKGSMGKTEGLVKASVAMTRMLVYSAGTAAMSELLIYLMSGDDDDRDVYTIIDDIVKKSAADIISIVFFGQKLAITKTAISTVLNGAIQVYENATKKYLNEEPINFKSSKGYYPFFGFRLNSYKDSLKTLGALGYVSIATAELAEETFKFIDKVSKGEFDKEEYDFLKLKMASLKLGAAMLGLPAIRDVQEIVKEIDKEVGEKKKTIK